MDMYNMYCAVGDLAVTRKSKGSFTETKFSPIMLHNRKQKDKLFYTSEYGGWIEEHPLGFDFLIHRCHLCSVDGYQ